MAQTVNRDTRLVLFSTDDVLLHTNTPSHFTVALPFHLIVADPRAGLEIEACHFHNRLDDAGARPDARVVYYKLFCPQVNTGSATDTSIATLDRPSQANKFIYHEPTRGVNIFKLFHSFVDTLTFRIVGYNYLGKQVDFKLLPGQPTVIKLNLISMSLRPKEISMPLRMESNGIYNEFAVTNTANNFRVSHSQTFNLDPDEGVMEVALSEISFIPKFDLPGGRRIPVEIRGPINTYRGSFNITSAELKDPKDLMRLVIRAISKIMHDNQTDINHVYTKFQLPVLTNAYQQALGIDRINMKKSAGDGHIIEMKAPNLVDEGDTISIFMPAIIWEMLGFSNHAEETLEMLNNMPVEVVTLAPHETLQGEKNCDPNAFQPDVGFIYCDFIKPVICGGIVAPMLRMFSLAQDKDARKSNEYKLEDFNKSLDYHELSKYDLTNLHFTLRDTSGRPLNFKKAKHNVMLTLQLRKRSLVEYSDD